MAVEGEQTTYTYEINGNIYEVTYNGEIEQSGYDLGEKFTVTCNGHTDVFYYHQSHLADNLDVPTVIDTKYYWTGSNGYNGPNSDGGECIPISNFYSDGNENYSFITNDVARNFYNENSGVRIKGSDCDYNSLMALQNYLEDTRNIRTNIDVFDGFSMGGYNQFLTARRYLTDAYNNGENPSPITIIANDPYANFALTSEEDFKPFVENGSNVIAFLNGQSRVDAQNSYLSNLARNDINTVIITIPNHSIKYEYEDGWISYFDGNISLEEVSNNHNYQIYVPSINEDNVIWNSYSFADLVEAKSNPDNATPELLNAINCLENCVIKSEKKCAEQAQELLSEAMSYHYDIPITISYTSTSQLLSQEQSMIHNVMGVLGKLQVSLVKKIKNVLYAADMYDMIDKKLMEESENIKSKYRIYGEKHKKDNNQYFSLDEDKIKEFLNEDIEQYRIDMVPLLGEENFIINKDAVLYTTTNFSNKSVYDIANLTADDINMLIESETEGLNSVLRGTGAAWIRAAEETGLDPLFLLAVARNESHLGTTDYALNGNNFFGMKYQQGVQYFGQNDNTGEWVFRQYAETPEEGIIKAAHWIKDFYVEQWGGKTPELFVRTGYSGNSGDTQYINNLVGIMTRMQNTYESTTGKQLEFIQNNGTIPVAPPPQGTTITSTSEPIITPTPEPTVTPTPEPTVTPAPEPTITPTPEPTVTPTPEPTITPTPEPTITPTPEPTITPTPEPTITPTPEPTITPTPEPTITPTPEPTITPTPEPTITTTPEPTITSTPEPTITPKPENQPGTSINIEAEPVIIETPPIEETPEIITPIIEPTEVTTPEPVTPVIEPTPTDNTTKGNSALGAIGIAAGIGAAAGAGIYVANRIKNSEDKKEEKEERYGVDNDIPSLEEQYAGFNKRIETETVEKYKSSSNDDGKKDEM